MRGPAPSKLSAVLALVAAAASGAGCATGTTSAPLPLYEASIPEGGNAFTPDVSFVASDAAHDAATVDATVRADTGTRPDTGTTPDTGATPDTGTGRDTGTTPDTGTGRDTGATPDTGTGRDTGATPDTGTPPDTGATHDSGRDSGHPRDAAHDSLARDAGDLPPVCMDVGTANEGWYTAEGTLLCTASCAGLTAKCEYIGDAQQGWYTTSGHGCPPHSEEIENDHNCG